MNFILGFDQSIKITHQSISNTKARNLPFKPLILTPDIEKFISYLKKKVIFLTLIVKAFLIRITVQVSLHYFKRL